MLAVYDLAARQDFAALVVALDDMLADFGPTPDVRDVLRLQVERCAWLLQQDSDTRSPQAQELLEARLLRLARGAPGLYLPLARRRLAQGAPDQALALLYRLKDLPGDDPAAAPGLLLEAMHVAAEAGNAAAVQTFGRRALAAVSAPAERLRLALLVARVFGQYGGPDASVDVLRSTAADGALAPVIELRGALVAALEAAGRTAELFDEAASCFAMAAPVDRLAPRDQNLFISMVRRVAQTAQSTRQAGPTRTLEERLAALTPAAACGPLYWWALSAMALARFDRMTALERLDTGLRLPPPPANVTLNLACERALIFRRYHLFGEALAELRTLPPGAMPAGGFYHRRLAFVQEIAAVCPDAEQPLRYPECLIDVILAEIAARPIGYTPQPRHLVMVSGSLGQGGGERQTLTVVRYILRDPRVARLSLLVRSTHLKPSDGFFWPEISRLPLDAVVYGKDWLVRTNVAAALPELADRPRLAQAIDLLPHNQREDIIRLCRQLWDRRPAAVHIWQDIYSAALACVITGVPHFFIHRGSLSPDHWEHNEYQAAVHFRIMQHAYRRLLERPDFVILNNSRAGCDTDQNWTGWPTPAPFQVLFNAVDYSQLGPNTGRNLHLRARLGIPPEAPVVGGSFRITPVKRPRVWIAAAAQIFQAVPEAHFLIIGDGELTDEAIAQAEELGFRHRLHLPGRVSNVGEWYRAMDVKLLTSEREGIPNAIIEAQHYGVPIVATHVGGIPEAIEEGITGYAIPGPPGGAPPQPYAQAVIGILRDQAWHEQARQRAQDFVHQKFSLQSIVDRLMTYYGFEPAADASAAGSIGG